MHRLNRDWIRRILNIGTLSLVLSVPEFASAQTSPFMTGATALQTNILAWLTPIAVILVMALGAMAMANRIAQAASTYGAGDAHTIVENCGNTLILRCSASEGGGTSRFASTLIGQREVVRTTQSRSRRSSEFLGSITHSEHVSIESAVMDSEVEQLPDLAGYLKFASGARWLRVALQPPRPAAVRAVTVPAFIPAPPVAMPAATAAPPQAASRAESRAARAANRDSAETEL